MLNDEKDYYTKEEVDELLSHKAEDDTEGYIEDLQEEIDNLWIAINNDNTRLNNYNDRLITISRELEEISLEFFEWGDYGIEYIEYDTPTTFPKGYIQWLDTDPTSEDRFILAVDYNYSDDEYSIELMYKYKMNGMFDYYTLDFDTDTKRDTYHETIDNIKLEIIDYDINWGYFMNMYEEELVEYFDFLNEGVKE